MQYLPFLLFAVLCFAGVVRPIWALALLLVMFPLEVSIQAGVGLFRTQGELANVIVAVVVGFAALHSVMRAPRPFYGHLSSPLFSVIAILGWSVLSLGWSPAGSGVNEGVSIIKEGAPYFVVFVLLGPILIGTMREWRELTGVMLIAGTLVALTIIVNPEFSIRSGRIGVNLEGAQRTSPLAIGQMGGMLAIFGALASGGRASWLQWSVRVVAFICGAMLALLSGTRGQVVFALIAIVLFLPMSRRLKNLASYFSLAIIVAVVAIGSVLIFEYVIGRSDTNRWGGGALAGAAEIRQWSVVQLLSEFIESPVSWIIGLGYNAFSAIEGAGRLAYVHNLYAEVLCELGIPMFVIFVSLFVMTARSGISLFRRYREQPAERSALAILLAMVLYQALIPTKEGNLWSAWSLFTFMLITTRIDRRAQLFEESSFDEFEYASDDEGASQDASVDVDPAPARAGQPA